MPIEKIDRALMRDRAYLILRDAIVSGELRPGEVVRDVEMAARVGLSRTPVREALARLADEGLVETKPHSWTRVTPLVVRDVRDAAVVVRTMHELAVRMAVPLMSEGHVDTMRVANVEFAAALEAGDIPEALRADDALHDVPVDVLGNRALKATIERYLPVIRRLERVRFGSLPGRRSVRLHADLIDACAGGEVAEAVAVTTEIWASLITVLDSEMEDPDDDS